MRYMLLGLTLVAAIAAVRLGLGQTPRAVNRAAKSDNDSTRADDAANRIVTPDAKGLIDIFVAPGDETEAKAYYNRIETPLGVTFIDDNPASISPKATDLDGLLAYLGYQNAVGDGIKAVDLETLDSFVLMPRDATEFTALDQATGGRIGRLLSLDDFWDSAASTSRVLAARFFAPKIATYYNKDDAFDPIDPADIVPGWRKLVRLRPRAGSPAAAVTLKYAYILFNFKKANADENPFSNNESANNQVILVPTTFNKGTDDAAFFAVYKSKTDSYALGFFLAADFDLPGHAAEQATAAAPDSKYYVPRACAACHGHGTALGAPSPGGKYTVAKSNYLDTDQWYDWMEFDFAGVAGSLNDVVFDGGKDHATPQYQRALNVFGSLNLGIEDDTNAAEPTTTPSFALLAVQKWLTLHQVNAASGSAGDVARKLYSTRALVPAGTTAWDPANPDEMRLLRLLDNHCFRCHSSMIYNVFDRSAVAAEAKNMRTRLNTVVLDDQGTPLPGFRMPQGRVLPGSTRAEMTRLLNKLFPSP